jgi:response regulator NasT
VVDAALAAGVVRAAEASASASPREAPMPIPEVLMAVGVLMHRHSLARVPAFERLHRLAQAEHRSVDEQAKLLLAAVEVLALPPGT